jgi:hypothetical protein
VTQVCEDQFIGALMRTLYANCGETKSYSLLKMSNIVFFHRSMIWKIVIFSTAQSRFEEQPNSARASSTSSCPRMLAIMLAAVSHDVTSSVFRPLLPSP